MSNNDEYLKPNYGQELIIKEVIALLHDRSNLILKITTKIPHIVLIILFNHYIQNTNNILADYKRLIWYLSSSMIYHTKCYNNRDVELYQAESFRKHGSIVYVFSIPLYIDTTDENVLKVQYIPYIHDKFISQVESEGTDEYNKTVNSLKYNIYVDKSYVESLYGNLFPSYNYILLSKIIRDHIDIGSVIGHSRPLCIVLNSISGLGKSAYSEYLVSNNIVSRVYRVDLNKIEFMDSDISIFNNIFNNVINKRFDSGSNGRSNDSGTNNSELNDSLSKNELNGRLNDSGSKNESNDSGSKNELNDSLSKNDSHGSGSKNESNDRSKKESNDRSLKEPSVFILDEIDKWLEEYTERSYIKLQTERIKNKEPTFVPRKRDHILNIKKDLILQLSSIMDSSIYSSCIIIFCSNNFSTIFEGLDMTHYSSFHSQFISVQFRPCDREEIIRFYQYYNEKFKEKEETQRFYQENIQNIFNSLSDNVCITYRKLTEISTLLCYDYEKIVLELNKNHCGPLIIEEKIIKNVNSLLEESLDDNYLINEISDYTSEINMTNDSTVAASSKNNESENLCEWCNNEPVKQTYHGVGLCYACVHDVYPTKKCWICHTDNSDYMLADKAYSETRGINLMIYICEKCLDEGRNKYPDYKVHNVVKCNSGCLAVKLITNNRKRFNICSFCNYTYYIKEQDFSVKQTTIENVVCELCKTYSHNKIFYCPEINSNCCESCSRPYVARKEIAVRLDIKLNDDEFLDQEVENNPIISLPLPEPELRYNLSIISCFNCGSWTLDPKFLTCDCSECCQLEVMIEKNNTYQQHDLTINIQVWSKCVRCIHEETDNTFLDLYLYGDINLGRKISIEERRSNNQYIKEFWSSGKCQNINNIELIECMNTVLHPIYFHITCTGYGNKSLLYNMALTLIKEKDYYIISRYTSIVQKALMLGWK